MRNVTLVLAAALVVGACAPAATTPAVATAATAATATTAPTATPLVPIKVRIIWTAASGAASGTWTAEAGGYYKEEGLDAELINIPSSSRSITAMIAKEAEFGHLDPTNLVEAVVAGAGVKAIVAITNNLVFSLITTAKINTLADLKGKNIGITRLGSSTHTAALQALRKANVDPKDVTFIQLQEVPAILAAMVAGQIDAGTVSPPTNTRAKGLGFKEMLNLAVDGPEYPSVAIGASTAYLAANPEAARRFVRAYSRGVQRFVTDKAFGITVLKDRLKLTDNAVLEDTWTQYAKYLVKVPYVSAKGLDQVILEYAETNPKAKGTKAEAYIDSSFVKALEDQGFYKKLYP
ncbi:MAG: ABC transporter substrate-binding protein [Candidatus Limnocylindria bacterium]|nr:ABC transporter substrate-binding protein [Candidatus Limnocylindria bacterium]